MKRPSRFRCLDCKATMNLLGALIHLLFCPAFGHSAYEMDP